MFSRKLFLFACCLLTSWGLPLPVALRPFLKVIIRLWEGTIHLKRQVTQLLGRMTQLFQRAAHPLKKGIYPLVFTSPEGVAGAHFLEGVTQLFGRMTQLFQRTVHSFAEFIHFKAFLSGLKERAPPFWAVLYQLTTL